MTHRLRIVVEVDPELVDGLDAGLVHRLARGVIVSTRGGHVQIDGLPGWPSMVFATLTQAVMHVHALAENKVATAEHLGGVETATGRWMLDRAAFLRLVAQELVQRREWLWPVEQVAA